MIPTIFILEASIRDGRRCISFDSKNYFLADIEFIEVRLNLNFCKIKVNGLAKDYKMQFVDKNLKAILGSSDFIRLAYKIKFLYPNKEVYVVRGCKIDNHSSTPRLISSDFRTQCFFLASYDLTIFDIFSFKKGFIELEQVTNFGGINQKSCYILL